MDEEQFDIAEVLLEFFEVAIHGVLFHRELYPKSIFTFKKKYGIPVHISTFPKLNHYITESLKGIKSIIENKKLEKMCICFYDKEMIPRERFVFNVHKLKKLTKGEILETNDPYLINLQESMRKCCLQLSVSECYLKSLSNRYTFKILMRAEETTPLTISSNLQGQKFPLVEIEETEIKNAKIIPIGSIQSEILNMEIFVEQHS